MKQICQVCFHHCALEEGQTGLCRARRNVDGYIVCINYGKITALALDPVEKKPLRRFHPGSRILSVGSFGCNFACPFCQNHEISMAGEAPAETEAGAGAGECRCSCRSVNGTPDKPAVSGQRNGTPDKPTVAGRRNGMPDKQAVSGRRNGQQRTGKAGPFAEYVEMSPAQVVRRALQLETQGNIGIAYTYNEPLVGWEFVRDCAGLAHAHGLKNVVVTNGSLDGALLSELLPYIDAFNIDLKGFTDEFYRMVHGSFGAVMDFIRQAAAVSHVEVTTLVIPGLNDSEGEIAALARWLAGVRPDIVLHLSRFFPCYHMMDRQATPVGTVYRLAEVARESLEFVYTGNC